MLREMALLQVVEEVEAHRLTAEMLSDEDRLISNVAAERSHRFLALVRPDPSANRIVRRAWTIAERLGGELDLLWVTAPEQADDRETDRRVEELRRLAAVFGAHMIVETDRSVARAVARVAARCQATHIVMGTPHPRQRFGRPSELAGGRDRHRRPEPGHRAGGRRAIVCADQWRCWVSEIEARGTALRGNSVV